MLNSDIEGSMGLRFGNHVGLKGGDLELHCSYTMTEEE